MSQSSKNAQENYDVIVIGGGLSGLTMTALLASQGMKALCLDREDPKKQIQADLRTTAISYGSSQILDKAGIWETLEPKGCPIHDIQILDGNSPVLLDFSSDEVEGKAFGWIFDNADLRTALMARVNELKEAAHITSVQVDNFVPDDEAIMITCSNGKSYKAALAIGADGRGSSMRRWMESNTGLETRQWSYNQRAVICVLTHENPHHNVAVEHFMPEGPFAVLPMHDDKKGRGRSALVFTEHGAEADSLIHYSEATFEAAVKQRLQGFYGDILEISKRQSYPLGLVHAADYAGPRMALVADAAHGIHPIAGQGLNLGFRDLNTLAGLLDKAHKQGVDLGSETLLGNYVQARRGDNMAMVAFTDGLNRLFSNNLKSVGGLRRAGLRAVSKLPWAKKFFMKRAMGQI